MNASLNRIILYVQDVRLLAEFYRTSFELQIVEEIAGEWAVFKAGACELALHRAGEGLRDAGSAPSTRLHTNVKLVLTVESDIEALRTKLIAAGVAMREMKSFPGFTGLLCDGTDPEGNVFQLAQSRP